MICVLTALLVVVAHTHRTVLLRRSPQMFTRQSRWTLKHPSSLLTNASPRIWLVLGLLYYYRAITMAVTVLPRPDPTYTCRPKVRKHHHHHNHHHHHHHHLHPS